MLTVNEEIFLNELKEYKINFNKINKLLVDRLLEKNIKIATAESCTGGLISKEITEISGSSLVFDCGVCSYSNEIKERVLKVDKNLLDTLGAVSSEVAIEMAKGVKELAQSNVAISTTGVAGPTGGTAEKPVGLVYIGVALEDRSFSVKALFNSKNNNDRKRIIELSANYAMYILYKQISD